MIEEGEPRIGASRASRRAVAISHTSRDKKSRRSKRGVRDAIRQDSRFAHLNEKRGENISLFNIYNQNAK